MTDDAPVRRSRVPAFLFHAFAAPDGRVMVEGRDRTRRLAEVAEAAAARCGVYVVAAEEGGGALARRLAETDAVVERAIGRMRAGAFPPPPADRAAVALLLGVELLVSRGPAETRFRAAQILGGLMAARLEGRSEDEEDAETEEPEQTGEEDLPEAQSLVSAPALARALAGWTWQLLRFARPLLLTGDTPAVLWTRTGSPRAHRFGLAGADEVRVPLDPTHALIVARHAPSGEIVRDLDERHARALNRTMAEGARRWMVYHPESDPLEGVELAPP